MSFASKPQVLAIIPARGGSKGVKGKNIRPIDGKPLIHYSIDVALECESLSAVYVTSDSDEILSVSDKPGVQLVKRPDELATDSASVIPTITHALAEAERIEEKSFDIVVLLQATSPIRETFHIDEAVSLLANNKEAASVISVCEMDDVHPARMYNMNDNKLLPFVAEYEQVRRQDIPPVYYRNGSIYAVKKSALLEQDMIMAKPSLGYVMPIDYLANIDDPRDLIITEALVKHWKSHKK